MNKDLTCSDYGYFVGDYFLVLSKNDNMVAVVSLVWDDGTKEPRFRVECANESWRFMVDDTLFITLKKVIKIEINDRQGLDLYCMLYPQATDVLTEWFNTRRFHELQRV